MTNIADKVYEPEVIQDTPFPGEPQLVPLPGQANPAGTYSPAITKDKPFKKKIVASETIGQALNTRSKKILQEFELQQSGGLKIGDFKSGISGDLRITPSGLTARDKAGITTFAIDGDTGDAVFKGEIRAGSLLTGGITVEDENGQTIIDGTGLVSTANFPYQATNGDTEAQIPDSNFVTIASLEVVLLRTTNLLVNYWGFGRVGTAGDIMVMSFNDSLAGSFSPNLVFDQLYDQTFSMFWIFGFGAGTHTMIIRARRQSGTGTAQMTDSYISVIPLGR